MLLFELYKSSQIEMGWLGIIFFILSFAITTNLNSLNLQLTGTAAGTCTLELVIDAGIATGIVCPLGRCNRRGNGPGTGLIKTKEGKLKKRNLYQSSLLLLLL